MGKSIDDAVNTSSSGTCRLRADKKMFPPGNGIIRIISILYIQLYSIICMYNLYNMYNKIFEFNGQNHETKVKVF
jgi:hypothetical protein